MGKKKSTKIFLKEIIDKKEDLKEKYIYLIKYSNGDEIWQSQKKIRLLEVKQLLKEYDKILKLERKGRKKNNLYYDKKENNLYHKILIKEYNDLVNELNDLKENNEKLKEEIVDSKGTYENIIEILESISKENSKLKNFINNKNEELNSIQKDFKLKINNFNCQIEKIKKKNKRLKKKYNEQKLENNKIIKYLNELKENNKLFILKNQEIAKTKYYDDLFNEEKEITINRLKDKIKQFEEEKKNNFKFNEIEEWKEKYYNLNEQYGKLVDALKRLKSKNQNLNEIYEKYKNKYGEINDL